MYRLTLHDSIDQINDHEWDSILKHDDIINRYNFIQALTESDLNDCNYYFAVIRTDEDQIVAHALFYTITTDIATMLVTNGNWLINLVRKLFPRFLLYKVTECGSPCALGNALTVADHFRSDLHSIISMIYQHMKIIAHSENAPLLLFRDYYEQQTLYQESFQNLGFIQAQNMPTVILAVEWASFNDYLHSLKYSYRRAVLSHQSVFQSEEVTVKVVKDFTVFIPRVHELYLECYHHAREYQRELLTPDFFHSLHKYLKKETSLLLIRTGDTIVGFSLLIEHNRHIKLLYVGFEYKTRNIYHTYFNLFFESLRYAIEQKALSLDLGITTYDFKLRMGGQLTSLYGYLRHLNRFVNCILKMLTPLLFPEHKPKPRHPFKQ